MTALDDFIAAVNAVDARLEALRPRILEHGDAPLPEGTWRVRDALSHLAARSNGVARILQRVEALDAQDAAGGPDATDAPSAPPAPRNIDEINAAQVEERTDRSVEALLDEIREGHQDAIAAARGLDDALLQRQVPLGFRPGDASVGDLLVMGGPRHDGGHLDQIEAALG
ncbi:MAG: DinB family protein [Dehalococcoidia bacterium]|nr:DinB family protein [Dehalococcoidia bacterium]